MEILKLIKYSKEEKSNWDEFVRNSKNGTFLFFRDYMDYHADRFADNSLFFYLNNNLIAILPANKKGNTIYSHGGLTYGGIISGNKMKTNIMLDIFSELRNYCKYNNIEKIVYKAIPYIYHSYPSDEDLYALNQNEAKLIKSEISSSISLQNPISFSAGKRQRINKLKNQEIKISSPKKCNKIMAMIKMRLNEKYDIEPTHTKEEMNLLVEKFPKNIKLYELRINEDLLAGAIIYETGQVAHAQYLTSNAEGKKFGALEYLVAHLINEKYKTIKYFDFGISTEDGGKVLNEGLINQKEEYGARGVVYNTFELKLF